MDSKSGKRVPSNDESVYTVQDDKVSVALRSARAT